MQVTNEQRHLIETLSQAQMDLERQASLVELFADDVDKLCLVLNSALGAGMSWEDISEMVAADAARGNPIAALVVSMKLDKHLVTIRLQDPFIDAEDDEQIASGTKTIEIDLSMSAFANARRLYGGRKTAKVKEAKTIEASVRVIQNVEAAAMKALEASKVRSSLKPLRHVYWFEKFNWFITTEGYLCLSGRDAQQNELLVKRYLRPGDAYVHADLGGASSCILRCKTDGKSPLPISHFALQEAGAMTVCRSGAWAAKAMVAAYWVHANQVSKTAPSGEYLVTGSFMIYGKKNYLSPMLLEMGFGIIFRLADESVFRHLGARKDKQFDGTSVAESVYRLDSDHDTEKTASLGISQRKDYKLNEEDAAIVRDSPSMRDDGAELKTDVDSPEQDGEGDLKEEKDDDAADDDDDEEDDDDDGEDVDESNDRSEVNPPSDAAETRKSNKSYNNSKARATSTNKSASEVGRKKNISKKKAKKYIIRFGKFT